MKKLAEHLRNFIYWIKKIMTDPLKLENCLHLIKPQDIISVVLVRKKNGQDELLVSTTSSRLPLRVPATPHNINLISLYCLIYESSEENDEDYDEIEQSLKNESQRRENRKRFGMDR